MLVMGKEVDWRGLGAHLLLEVQSVLKPGNRNSRLTVSAKTSGRPSVWLYNPEDML